MIYCCKVVALRVGCVLAGASLTRMTSTGRVVREARGLTEQVLRLDTVAMVSSSSNMLFI